LAINMIRAGKVRVFDFGPSPLDVFTEYNNLKRLSTQISKFKAKKRPKALLYVV
jgi:hypothetical protein